MKRKRIHAFFLNPQRKKHIISNLIIICTVLIIISSLVIFYYIKTKKSYANYDEYGNVNYKVYLKKNDFFNNNYVVNEEEYVSALIDYIDTEFAYRFMLDQEDINYEYSYGIDAVVNIMKKDSKNILYNYVDSLIDNVNLKEVTNKDIEISKVAKIDYEKYNNIAKNFISLYDLDNIIATLTINYYVDVTSDTELFEEDVTTEAIYSLVMPLNEKTTNINLTSKVSDKSENMVTYKKEALNLWWVLVLIVILIAVDIKLFVDLIDYLMKCRTAESIYHKELKRILNNYGSYIQKVNNPFDIKNYSILELDTFTDMLEIRETIQEPIIMLENEEKKEAYFMIIGRMNILYAYYIRVSDIKKSKNTNIKFS